MSQWEDFDRDVMAESSQYYQRGCAVGELLASLSAEDAGYVQAALDRRELSSRAIHAALKRRLDGEAPSAYTVRRHRVKECRCSNDRGVETK